jgi:hypothetical protein
MPIQYATGGWLVLLAGEALARGGGGYNSCHGYGSVCAWNGFVGLIAFCVISLVVLFIKGLLKQRADERKSREEEAFLVRQYIPRMAPNERELIGYLLFHNKKTFVIDDQTARAMMKRYIAHWTARPEHGQISMKIPDHIWQLLIRHRSEFPYTPTAGKEPIASAIT